MLVSWRYDLESWSWIAFQVVCMKGSTFKRGQNVIVRLTKLARWVQPVPSATLAGEAPPSRKRPLTALADTQANTLCHSCLYLRREPRLQPTTAWRRPQSCGIAAIQTVLLNDITRLVVWRIAGQILFMSSSEVQSKSCRKREARGHNSLGRQILSRFGL